MNAYTPSPLAFADAITAANAWVRDATDLIAQYHRYAADRDRWTARAADACGSHRWRCIDATATANAAALATKDQIEAVRDDVLSSLYLTAHNVPAALVEAADDYNDRLSDDCISVADAIAGMALTRGRHRFPAPAVEALIEQENG